MANLGNTIVNGALRVNGKINSSDVISAPSFVGALTGNADTATKLKTARTINGVSFDGSANITVADSTKLPLTGGTLSGDLNFSHAGSEHPASIGWNTGTIRQRIRIFDEGATDNNVFEFQQSRDNGSTYTTLMAITADNKVKATTFVGALSGNASSATKATQDSDGNAINTTYLKVAGGAITGAITRNLASSGTITTTNIFSLNGSTDGLKLDYESTTADLGRSILYTIDDANAVLSLGNKVSGAYKEAIKITDGFATINGICNRIDISGKTVDVNTYTLSSGAPDRMCYIEKSDGGSSNITNIPVTGKPFLLDVELIRWASTTDYVTRQIFTNKDNPNNSYVRYCTNGTWSAWTTRVYTDKNVTISNTNPTAGTWYYPVWYTGTSGTGSVNANDGLRHYSLQGTASAAGKTILQLGNATATGTAGNKYGEVRIYAEKAGFATLKATASATTESVHIFPTTGGTLLNTGTTSFTQTVTAGTKIGAIKINGTSQDILIPTSIETANKSKLLDNLYTGATRPTSADVTITGSGGLATFKATASMTTGKPTSDAHILHMYWDNTGGHDSQLAVLNGNSPMIQLRGQSATTWGNWITVPRSTDNSTNNIVAMSTADYNSVKDSLPNGSLVAVW